ETSVASTAWGGRANRVSSSVIAPSVVPVCATDQVRHCLRAAVEQQLEAVLVQDRPAEVAGLGLLGPGAGTDHHEVSLLRHRSGSLAAAGEDLLLGPVPGVVLQRPGDHDAQAG